MPLQGDELPSFYPSILHSTQLDLPNTPPAARIPRPNITGFDNYDLSFPVSPQIYFTELVDVDMLGVNAACCAAGGITEIQHLEEEGAQRPLDSGKQSDGEQEQRLFAGVEPLTAPDEKLAPAPALAPEDGCSSGTDAGMPEINDAATQLPVVVGWRETTTHLRTFASWIAEEYSRRFALWRRAIMEDLFADWEWAAHRTNLSTSALVVLCDKKLLQIFNKSRYKKTGDSRDLLRDLCEIPTDMGCSIVPFTGPDSKGRNNQGRWKEKSMKGMRAVADPSSPPQPLPGQQEQEQGYVGLNKTLELDDDGNGNRWRAHEYTPLLQPDDDPSKLVPAEISLRFEFKVKQPAPSSATKEDEAAPSSPKEDEPAPSPAFSLPSKRFRSGAPKDGPTKTAPRKSQVWKHMTQVYVKDAASNKDGTQRKKPTGYKVKFAICHHCDKVFNAPSEHGTHNLSNHLDSCNDCKCMHSHPR